MPRKQKSIYLAGPMTGYPQLNFPAFEAGARRLEEWGWAVHNPATSFNGAMDLPYKVYMAAAVNMLCQAEAIAVMEGWQGSRGATMEALIAQRLGLPFYNAETGRPMTVEEMKVQYPRVISDGSKPFPANHELLKSLEPLATELALKKGNRGITVSDVRVKAEKEGILSGEEHPNQLSALGHLCRRAGLKKNGETRRSELEVTHGIRQTVWVHPSYSSTTA